jgi:hypothetical protein
MAPNRKHISPLSVQLPDLKVIRSKDQVYQPQKPVVESASYWEWSPPSSDDYWSESNQDDEHDELAALPSSPQRQVESLDYWKEASQSRTESDNYWNTDSFVPPSTIRSTAVNPSESAAYWQEQTHARAIDCANNYWAESRPSESSDGNYWQWSATVRPESDNYWQWSAVRSEGGISVCC